MQKKATQHIDWTYQLLTTNAGNLDKQATTYGYTIQAANLMNGVTLQGHSRNNIKLGFHVFNAGVNEWGAWNGGQKTRTQRRENRRAYLHLTDKSKTSLASLGFTLPDNSRLNTAYSNLQKMQLGIAEAFNKCRNEYNEQSALLKDLNKDTDQSMIDCCKARLDEISHRIIYWVQRQNELNDEVRKITYQIEQEHILFWKEHDYCVSQANSYHQNQTDK